MSKRKRAIKQQRRSEQPLKASSGVHKRNRKARHPATQQTCRKHTADASAHFFSETQHILCVGEGNFSFARAIVRLLNHCGENVVATVYDTKDTVSLKYEVTLCSCRQAPLLAVKWNISDVYILQITLDSHSCPGGFRSSQGHHSRIGRL